MSSGWRRETAWLQALAWEEAAMDFRGKWPFESTKKYERARRAFYSKEERLGKAACEQLRVNTESGRAAGTTFELSFRW